MARLLYQWEPHFTSSISRNELALRYLELRGQDIKVLHGLVEGDYWKATQDTVREHGASWLTFDAKRLSSAETAFNKEAGIQDIDDWSSLERDDIEDAEGRALWDILHAEQARWWRGDEETIAKYARRVLVYPDLLFQRISMWERLDSLAETRYEFARKQALVSASKGTSSDFEAARFTHLPSYDRIALVAHKERPKATSSELVNYAWGLYRIHRSPNANRRQFGSALRNAIRTRLPQLAVDKAQSQKAKARRAI